MPLILKVVFQKSCMEKEKTVISLGGSLICPDGIDRDFVSGFRETILSYLPHKDFRIVTGGGRVARQYMEAADHIASPTRDERDYLGIAATRMNALFMKTIFPRDLVHSEVIDTPGTRVETDSPIVLYCGERPGHSTDYDAVLVAKAEGVGKVINMGGASHVYSADPRVVHDASQFDRISWDTYRTICGNEWSPGLNAPFDPIASREAQKSGLSAYIIGKDLDNLINVLDGRNFDGTIIQP